MKRHTRSFGLLLLLSAGCASATDGTRVGEPSSPNGKPAHFDAGGTSSPTSCVTPKRTAATAERDRGVDAFVRGSLREAIDVLGARVRSAPNDIAAQALLVASKTRADLASKRTASALERLPTVRLGPLPGQAQQVKALAGPTSGASLKVDRVSEKSVAVLASTEDWMKANGLKKNLTLPRPEDLPDGAPQALGARADRVFSHADHEIVRYGTILLVVAPGRAPLLFDTKALHEIQFAQVVGRALVVASWRNGYAKDVEGRTGFVAAYALDGGSLLWSSEPLVAAHGGFVVTQDHVVAGYGFTAEPDHLFVLELATGKTVQKVALKSGPDFILRNGDKIFVRTYDSEAVFRLSPNAGPAPKAELAAQAEPAAPMNAQAACWVESAVAAVDARDTRALAQAIDGLKASGAEPDVAGGFDGVQLFLDQQSSSAKAIDLTTRQPKRLGKPPWVYTLKRAATAPVTGTPKLAERAASAADPARNVRRRGTRVESNQPFFLAPVDMGRLPPGARPDIPGTFGLEHLRAANPIGDKLVLVYGGRYVAVVNGSETEAIFDLEEWRTPPRVNEQWKEFAMSDATFGIVEDGVLYVGSGGGSYAREMGGTKGYVSAIDMKTGELLWRSQPLVQGPGSFVSFKGFLLTGYGFTGEGDFVYLLRKDTGQVVTKLAVKSAPTNIQLSGNVATVETYDAVHVIEIKE